MMMYTYFVLITQQTLMKLLHERTLVVHRQNWNKLYWNNFQVLNDELYRQSNVHSLILKKRDIQNSNRRFAVSRK